MLCVQLMTAIKRLSTTFGDKKGFLGPEGSFQDLMRFVIAAAYSHSMQKGRVTSEKNVDLIDTHQYNEGELSFCIAASCSPMSWGFGA